MPFFVDVGGLKSLAALEAGDETIGAVELDQTAVRSAGELVQAVDILRDQAEQLTALFEFAYRLMADVGLDGFEKLVGGFLELPVLHPRGFAGEKILEQHRLVFCPDAAGAAEVGHAGFGADAGAGEKNQLLRLTHSGGKFFELHERVTRPVILPQGPRVLPVAPALPV